MVRDAIVVGCGIIGATVSKALVSQGRDVLTLDDNRPFSGTVPSGGHLKPSWFSGMKKSNYEPAMELLAELWGMKEETFSIWPLSIPATVYRVDTDEVVKYPRTVATVSQVGHLNNYPSVIYTEGSEVKEARCRLLVIASGVWASSLVPELKITAKQGVSFRLPGKLSQPLIRPWAPYKQVVAHQQSDNEIWIGDGSAILQGNWTEDRTKACLARCSNALGIEEAPLKTLVGLRPYVTYPGSDPCFLKQLGARAWVATGAGKSGTIAAGWVTRRILDADHS